LNNAGKWFSVAEIACTQDSLKWPIQSLNIPSVKTSQVTQKYVLRLNQGLVVAPSSHSHGMTKYFDRGDASISQNKTFIHSQTPCLSAALASRVYTTQTHRHGEKSKARPDKLSQAISRFFSNAAQTRLRVRNKFSSFFLYYILFRNVCEGIRSGQMQDSKEMQD
jgi:hypothetical protein